MKVSNSTEGTERPPSPPGTPTAATSRRAATMPTSRSSAGPARPFPEAKMDADFPAAHSMDTAWYAVDHDGYVGFFDTGEEGHIPRGALTVDDASLPPLPDGLRDGLFTFDYGGGDDSA